jgi:hypothetical protein
MGCGGEWADRVRELEAENARLRALPSKMLGIVRGYADGCSVAVESGSSKAVETERTAWEILTELEAVAGSGVSGDTPDAGRANA